MNEEHQMQEMKNIACLGCKRLMECDESIEDCCGFMVLIEALYNEGYRKQIEGEWIDVHHMSRSNRGRYTSYYTYTCGVCKESNGRRKTPYCPNCGAKMKGGE